MSLADKIRRSRESWIAIGAYELKIRRPTDLQMSARPEGSSTIDHMEFWSAFVIDWRKVREVDLYPGGTDQDAAFHLDDFREWFADRPADWEKLIDAIRGAWVAHHEKQAEDSKNL